jgi:L-alanine-DL-glutamate epimerase and related enzymes of enolase superfamily
MLHTEVIPHTLHFKNPAGTSRGVYTTRNIWYVKITDDSQPCREGIGECAPLHDLSMDASPNYEKRLRQACSEIEKSGHLDTDSLRDSPSMLFGLETAFRNLTYGNIMWDSPFARGEEGLRINGLIWMGDYDTMLSRIEEKMQAGFHCIKLKIGAIDFEKEIALLKHIRNHYSAKKIEIRVDANGAFSAEEAMAKLERLAKLDLHSIEQPIRAGQWQEMAKLTRSTPLPIALDEELIGINNTNDKRRLIETIRPQYIILKPTLHGGIQGSEEWIKIMSETSESENAWWITSALESNVGLNAIAQWSATLNNPMPQGLGTGQLFTDNILSPLTIQGEKLWYKKEPR